MAPTALREMDWATYRYVRQSMANNSGNWSRFQWGRLYADGAEIHTPMWAKVPVSHGLRVAHKATEMESEIWIDADRGGYEGTTNGALTTIRVDCLGPVQLEHSFTVVVAKQAVDGLSFYPQNRWINKHVPNLPNGWRGNVLVLKHGKTADKRIIHMVPEDFALVDLVVKHGPRCLIDIQFDDRQDKYDRRLRTAVVVANPASEVFFRTDELRRLALSYLPLLALFTYAHASRFTRGDVMSIARERIMRYVKPFFAPANHIPSLFYAMENNRAWIVGSVALAVLSFGADVGVPCNLNLISSSATEESWISVMCDVLGFSLRSSSPCKGYYASLGKHFLVFKHADVPEKSVTITIARAESIVELFLQSRTTLKANAVTAHELVAVYPDLTSNFEGLVGMTHRLDSRLYPRSPFPRYITLYDYSECMGRPCGSACPAVPRRSTNTAGIGHWAWAGIGNLEWEEDPVLRDMATSDVKYLLTFLRNPSTPALVTDIYNVDFKDGVYGSYALDETACTDDDGAPYYTYIVGQVCMLPTFEDANWHFRISGGTGANEELCAAFARQLIQLAAMVKEADEEDFDLDRNIAVENFTDADRYSLLGGTWIEFMMSLPPVFRERDGDLIRTQPTGIRNYPMKLGDWVLVRASLHRWDDRSGYNIRDIASGETTEEDTLSETSVTRSAPERLRSRNVTADEAQLLERAPVPAGSNDEALSAPVRDEEGPTASAHSRPVKRPLSSLSPTADGTQVLERGPVPVTPKQKRARKRM
ncbi:hypothetical protein K438DRAFT_1955278 [Mycena galopus ATCC 62051]|nr:hypothetical protein K438DRAFT_1955278 [Mycena galopus ATCC 62051]